MTSQSTDLTVRLTLDVAAPQARAFTVCTERIGAWWPATHHIGQAPLETVVLEPREGGRWFERGRDGSECDWGRVQVWDPPQRLVLDWMLSADWKFDPDPSHASEVEFRLIATGPNTTRLEFEHRKLEVYGARAADLRKGISAPDGWPAIVRSLADLAAA
jgi:uncharacterized protein YndB with AHSA1/START domain